MRAKQNIKKKLIEVLEEFNVSESQIFSLTTDGAPNILGVSRLINDPNYDSEGKDKDDSAKNSTQIHDDDENINEYEFEVEEIIVLNEEEEAALNVRFQLENFKRFVIQLESSLTNVIGKLTFFILLYYLSK